MRVTGVLLARYKPEIHYQLDMEDFKRTDFIFVESRNGSWTDQMDHHSMNLILTIVYVER